MAEAATHHRMPEQHPERHETGGLGFFMILSILVSLCVLAVVVFFVLYWLFGYFDRRDNRLQPPLTAVRQAPLQSPEPRLQGIPNFHPNTPPLDLQKMRKENETILQSYGPTSDAGFVRIPIDRAIELVVEKNLLAPTTQAKIQPAPTQKGAPGASR
jgi:hypothetical protein